MELETQVSPDAETQNPAPEVAETPEVATPEVEPQEDTGDPHDDADKALKRLQRRIDKRTADVYRERAEKEQLARRVAELESRDEQKPEQKPNPVISEEQIRAQAREIARIERFNEQCNAIVEKGKKLSGFDDALVAVVSEVGPLIDQKGGPTPLMTVILESEKPHELLHWLGTNPDKAAELADLTPTQMARRIDRIERDMAAKPKTSSAPKPLTPVKPQASSGAPSDSDSTEDWIRKEAARLNAKRNG